MKDETTVEKTEDEDIIKAAIDCLKSHEDRESDNIKRAEEAIRFRAGEQWPSIIKADRENPHQDGGARPCPVLDKTDQYVRQIINEERLNRAAIKVRPVDDKSDPKTAEIITGIIRHIEDASEALVAYTTAGEHAVDGGFGYFRLIAEYADDMAFDQEIRVKRIHNRFSVAPGYHSESDGADMQECVVWEDVSKEEFKKEYPDAEEVSFTEGDDWSSKDMVRIGEYYRIETSPQTIHKMDTGEVFTDEDLEKIKEQATLEGDIVPEPVDTRETLKKEVKWYKCTKEEILDQKDIPGRFIPIFKVTGNELTMPDGKIRLSGVIDAAMDAQRLHNYAHAGFIEHVALAPRSPWVAEEEQVAGYEDDYANANRLPVSLLKYKSKAEDGHLLPMPQRTQAAGMPPGWQQAMQNTEHGVEAAFGMYGASVGAKSQEKSGIALQEQKAQGAIGQYQFPDNLSRSIQHCGRVMLEWIPVYYDAATVARILGEDGEQEVVNLDPKQQSAVMPQQDEFGEQVGHIYNITLGKYDVTVSTGPSYSAKRQEAAEMQMNAINSNKELMPLIGDIAFSNIDAPGSDKISERLKALLPPEIKSLEENKEKNIPPEMQAQMQQIEQSAQMLEEKGQQIMQLEQEVKAAAQEAGNDKTEAQAQKKELDSAKRVFMADAKTMKSELEMLGMRLVNQLEDITDPLMKELSERTVEIEEENEETGEIETIVVQDPAMIEVLQGIASLTQQSTAQMAQMVNNALMTVTQAIEQPRQTTLQTDEAGNPVGSVSGPMQDGIV